MGDRGKSAGRRGTDCTGQCPDGCKGWGRVDPATGLHRGYDTTETGPTWAEILHHWDLIELDLHDRFGVDVESGVLRERSGRWLRLRILGLLSADTRLWRAMNPNK